MPKMLHRTSLLQLSLLVGLTQSKLVMTYFPIAGRGELARLYAVVGSVALEDSTMTAGYKQNTPIGYLPALKHPEAGLFPNCTYSFGCMQESLAVERYIANLSPMFRDLKPEQKAMDDYFAMIKEDLIHVEPGAANASIAKQVVTPLYDRYLPVLEKFVPASGFVNGLHAPTGADLAILVLLKSGFPYGKALQNAAYDGASRFPKVYAIAERTAKYSSVADYLKTSKTFYRILAAEGI